MHLAKWVGIEDVKRFQHFRMVGITNFHKIFKGRKEIPEEELKAGLISGGVAALAEKLRTSHGWDSTTLLAAPLLALEAGAVADCRWAVWKFIINCFPI